MRTSTKRSPDTLSEAPHFRRLFALYPSIIALLSERFDSHAFLRSLFQRHQGDYATAVAICAAKGIADPVREVNRILALHLRSQHHLIRRHRDTYSMNVFGNMTKCATWKKL